MSTSQIRWGKGRMNTYVFNRVAIHLFFAIDWICILERYKKLKTLNNDVPRMARWARISSGRRATGWIRNWRTWRGIRWSSGFRRSGALCLMRILYYTPDNRRTTIQRYSHRPTFHIYQKTACEAHLRIIRPSSKNEYHLSTSRVCSGTSSLSSLSFSSPGPFLV